MRRTPITLGILSIVFGSLVALSSVMSLLINVGMTMLSGRVDALMKSLPHGPGQPDPAVIMARTAELTRQLAPYTDALMGGRVALSIALIVIGCGMYRRRRWSRSGALGWSGFALLFMAVEAIVTITIVTPRTAALMKDLVASNPGMPQLQSFGATWTVLMAVFLYAPFPLVLLALCGRRSASGDFTE